MEMKAKATDNVTSVKLNVIKLFTCTQVLVLEIRKNVIEIGIRVVKQIHLKIKYNSKPFILRSKIKIKDFESIKSTGSHVVFELINN